MVAGITSLGVDALVIGAAADSRRRLHHALAAGGCRHRALRLANPYEDNGIKFFRHDGFKLDDAIEKRIEDLVFSGEIESVASDGHEDRQGLRVSTTRWDATSSLRSRVSLKGARSSR